MINETKWLELAAHEVSRKNNIRSPVSLPYVEANLV